MIASPSERASGLHDTLPSFESKLLGRLDRKFSRFTPVRPALWRAPVGTLSVTFDDFPRSAWIQGGTILRAHGVRGTYYMSGDLCGRTIHGQAYFEPSDLAALQREGHEIGSHLFYHQSVLQLSEDALRDGIQRNEAFAAEHLGDRRMTNFAYPYGDLNLRAKRLCGKSFSSSRGVAPGINSGRVDLGDVRAFCFEHHSLERTNWAQLLSETAWRKAWMVVLTHDVSDNPSPYGCRPEDLDRLIRLARKAGLAILPAREAMAVGAYAEG